MLASYSFANVSLSINGVEMVDWAEGDDIITCARRENAVNDVVGADGKMTPVVMANKSGTITFSLKHSSASCQFLYDMSAAAQADTSAFVPLGVQMNDIKLADTANGTQGYISKPADMVRGANLGTAEWELVVEDLDLVTGALESALANALSI